MSGILIYGATGYTGQLIVQQAVDTGLKPIIAGRSAGKIERLAEKHGLQSCVFGLVEGEIVPHLQDVDAVIHAAGPYIHTAEAMIKACIAAKTHYLDITGEISVFELAKGLDEQAKAAGVMVMSGTGFDVVPTDCLSALLYEELPSATHLELAFMSRGGASSHGTAKTAVESIGYGGSIRRDGKIVRVKSAFKSKKIDFGEYSSLATTIPWGDVSTAYTSTGIPNIEVYMSAPKKMLRNVKLTRYLGWLLRSKAVIRFIQKRIDKLPAGPTAEQRNEGRSYIWGKVTDSEGNVVEKRLQTPNGYTLTAFFSVHIAQKVLAGNFKPGYQTPSLAYGWKLVEEMEGCIFS